MAIHTTAEQSVATRESTPAIVHEVLRSPGQPMAAATRAFMEPRFDHDFSQVRVHADARAADAAHAVGARAYTVGDRVVMGAGQYRPHSADGRRLLAHELAHVVQQAPGAAGAVPGRPRITDRREPAEVDAARVAAAVTTGVTMDPGRAAPEGAAARPVTPLRRGTIAREETGQAIHQGSGMSSSLPGTEYTPAVPVNVKFRGDRLSFSVELHLKRDTGGDGKVQTQLLKTSAFGLGSQFAAALAEVTVDVCEIVPGVTAKLDLNALEAKVSGEEIDISLFEVKFGLAGELSKDIQGTALGDAILAGPLGPGLRAGTVVEIGGEFTIAVAPADAARLSRMATASRQLARNGAQVAEAKRVQQRLLAEQRSLRSIRNTRRAKLSGTQRRRLAQRLERNAGKLAAVEKAIRKRIRVNSRLRDEIRLAQKGLKGRLGRLAGKAVAKLGGRLLAKLVPGLNIITTALDIYEATTHIYRLAKGEISLGGGGESGGGESGGKAAGVQGESRDGGEEGDGGPAAPTRSEGGPGAGAAVDAGVPLPAGFAKETELPPETDTAAALDTSDLDAMGVSGDRFTTQGPRPVLHPAATAVVEALRGPGGVRFTSRDLLQLGDAVPRDLTGEETAAMLARLRGGKPASDVYAAIGAVTEAVRSLRAKEPVVATVTEAGATQTVAVPAELAEPAPVDAVTPTPRERPDIADFLRSAKVGMRATSRVYGTFEKEAEIRTGMALQTTMAFRRENGSLVGGNALLIVGSPVTGGLWSATYLALPVYDESGRLAGHQPSGTFEADFYK